MDFNAFFKDQIEPVYTSSIDPLRLQQARQYSRQLIWLALGVLLFSLLAGWYFDSSKMAFKTFALSFIIAQILYVRDYPYPDHEKPGFFIYVFMPMIAVVGFLFLYRGLMMEDSGIKASTIAGTIAVLISASITVIQSPERAALKCPLNSLKGEVLSRFLQHFFPKMHLVDAMVADRSFLEQTRMFNFNFNQVDYGAALEGKWGNHQLLVQKVVLKHKTKSKNGEYVSTRFKGFVALLDKGHALESPLVIRPHRDSSFSDLFIEESDRIEMEDPIFEKIYDVVSPQEFEARKLITPSFMHKVTQLSTGEVPFYGAYFDKNKTLIPIEADCSFFEADYASVEEVRHELSEVIDVLDQVMEVSMTVGKV